MKHKFLAGLTVAVGVAAIAALSAFPVLAADDPSATKDEQAKTPQPEGGTQDSEKSLEEMLANAKFKPAFPVMFDDEQKYVDALHNDVVVINFDALPYGPAAPPGFDRDGNVVSPPLYGSEWWGLGAVFRSPIGAALRTVSQIDYIGPDGTDQTANLFVSRGNSLTVGAAPYTSPLSDADNLGVTDENDDSLIIDLVTPKAGVGFWIIDQDGTDTSEAIIFRDANGLVIQSVPLPTALYPAHEFVGMVSFTRPIAQVEIVETANNGDDISIDHVILSN